MGERRFRNSQRGLCIISRSAQNASSIYGEYSLQGRTFASVAGEFRLDMVTFSVITRAKIRLSPSCFRTMPHGTAWHYEIKPSNTATGIVARARSGIIMTSRIFTARTSA